jgi:hypothetical protein
MPIFNFGGPSASRDVSNVPEAVRLGRKQFTALSL